MLLVDDEASMLRMLEIGLEGMGMEVATAQSAQLAMDQIAHRAHAPLLVLLDVMMPGTDGLTLARRFSAQLPRTKIAVMSGHLTEDSWWPDDLRDVAFLTKPFPLQALRTLVDEARADLLEE